MTPPPPLPDDVFAALPPAVQAYIRSLEAIAAQVAVLQTLVAGLEARLGQDSSNSSKPPSSDPPHAKPAPPRAPSGRRKTSYGTDSPDGSRFTAVNAYDSLCTVQLGEQLHYSEKFLLPTIRPLIKVLITPAVHLRAQVASPSKESHLLTDPPSQAVPSFFARSLSSRDDATVFLHAADLTGLDIPFPTGDGFQQVAEYLGTPDAPPGVEAEGHIKSGSAPGEFGPRFAAAGRLLVGGPRMSAAGEVQVGRVGDTDSVPPRTARGLACLADRGRSVSVTLRSVTGPGGEDERAKPPPWLPREGYFKPNFEPSDDRNPGKDRFWFSIRDQVDALFQAIFGSTEDVTREPAHGLVVLTGATNSAKTKITQGVIHRYLAARLKAGGRRPHLVTFEDPIETFLYDPKAAEQLPEPKSWDSKLQSFVGYNPDQADEAVHRANCHARLLGLPKPLLAQWHDYDYTPREKGTDVRDLRQAFADALRQTPAVFYVGEIRDLKDWAEVLEFAGTGHLVITTAHAGSLLEAMMKIMNAVGADTAADRRRFAVRIRAVVHLRRWAATRTIWAPSDTDSHSLVPDSADPSDLLEFCSLVLPTVWRQTDPGLAALSANGFGAIVPEYPSDSKLGQTSCLGRKWFARKLRDGIAQSPGGATAAWKRAPDKANTGAAWELTDDHVAAIGRTMDQWAAKADLEGK